MEEKDTVQKLKDMLHFEKNQGKISKDLIGWTWEYLTTKFEHRLPLLCNRHFMYVLCGYVADNCFTESENSSISRDTLGPKPLY